MHKSISLSLFGCVSDARACGVAWACGEKVCTLPFTVASASGGISGTGGFNDTGASGSTSGSVNNEPVGANVGAGANVNNNSRLDQCQCQRQCGTRRTNTIIPKQTIAHTRRAIRQPPTLTQERLQASREPSKGYFCAGERSGKPPARRW